jgi:hypothetical protein
VIRASKQFKDGNIAEEPYLFSMLSNRATSKQSKPSICLHIY